MAWLNDDTNNILALGTMSTGLLTVLEVYHDGKRLDLTEKDRDNLEDAITFFDYAIDGCDGISDPKKLFQYDENFPATPASALKLTFEILEGDKKNSDINTIQEFCKEFKEVLEKIQKKQSLAKMKNKLEKTRSFFYELGRRADMEMSQKIYSVPSSSRVSNFWTPV
jgi:hypothetical protein